jgi:hypothetical protein
LAEHAFIGGLSGPSRIGGSATTTTLINTMKISAQKPTQMQRRAWA